MKTKKWNITMDELEKLRPFEEVCREMYECCVKGLLECEVPSHEFDLYINSIHAYHAFCVRKKNKDNLESKPRSD